jgi:hypothetical protein
MNSIFILNIIIFDMNIFSYVHKKHYVFKKIVFKMRVYYYFLLLKFV